MSIRILPAEAPPTMSYENLKGNKEIVCFLQIKFREDQIFRRTDEKPANEIVGSLGIASPQFSPERVARARRCPEIQGTRETKRAGVLYSTSSPLSERNAVDSGRCAPAAVSW